MMEHPICKQLQFLHISHFVGLIFYILKTQEKRDIKQEEREKSYQHIISKLTQKFNIVEVIKKDVEEIKEYISKG